MKSSYTHTHTHSSYLFVMSCVWKGKESSCEHERHKLRAVASSRTEMGLRRQSETGQKKKTLTKQKQIKPSKYEQVVNVAGPSTGKYTRATHCAAIHLAHKLTHDESTRRDVDLFLSVRANGLDKLNGGRQIKTTKRLQMK